MIIHITDHLYTFIIEREGTAPQKETFIPRSGISAGANLREAFRRVELMQQADGKVLVLIDTPTVQVPYDNFIEEDAATLFYRCFEQHKGHEVLVTELAPLRCFLLFEVSKDWQQVLHEQFAQVEIQPWMQPIWQEQYNNSQNSLWKKLFVYFHDQSMELFAFDRNRFRFCNRFSSKHPADCAYFIVNAWQQMGFNVERDELHLLGEYKQMDEIKTQLSRHLRKIITQ